MQLTEAGHSLRHPACDVPAAVTDALLLDQDAFASLKRQVETIAVRLAAADAPAPHQSGPGSRAAGAHCRSTKRSTSRGRPAITISEP